MNLPNKIKEILTVNYQPFEDKTERIIRVILYSSHERKNDSH